MSRSRSATLVRAARRRERAKSSLRLVAIFGYSAVAALFVLLLLLVKIVKTMLCTLFLLLLVQFHHFVFNRSGVC